MGVDRNILTVTGRNQDWRQNRRLALKIHRRLVGINLSEMSPAMKGIAFRDVPFASALSPWWRECGHANYDVIG
jgi:hypothetical protein